MNLSANSKRLNALTREFTPDRVSFTLALNSESTLEESMEGAGLAIQRLKEYVNNGHSTAGLNFDYVSIKKF